MALGGCRLPHLQVCRILIKMADGFFSSLWRIREPYGCAELARPLLEAHECQNTRACGLLVTDISRHRILLLDYELPVRLVGW